MNTIALASVPNWPVVIRRQFALLLHSRRVWILIALCTMPLLLYELTRNSMMNGELFWRRANHPLVNVTLGLILVGAIWPMLVWRGEPWGKRDYHSLLPVDRMTHDLLRALAGAAWLMIGLCVAALLGLFVTMHLHGGMPIHRLDGSGHAHFHTSAAFWGNFFLGPLIVYTFATILPLSVRRPLEWTVALFACFLLILTVVLPVFALNPGQVLFDFLYHPFGIETALWGETSTRWYFFLRDSGLEFSAAVAQAQNAGTDPYPPAPPVSQWIIATSIWLSVGVVGVLVAAMRRR